MVGRAAEIVEHPIHIVGAIQVIAKVRQNAVVCVDFGQDIGRKLAVVLVVGVQRNHGQDAVILRADDLIADLVRAHAQDVRALGLRLGDLAVLVPVDRHAVRLEHAHVQRALGVKLPELDRRAGNAVYLVQQRHAARQPIDRRGQYLDMIQVPVAIGHAVQQRALADLLDRVIKAHAQTRLILGLIQRYAIAEQKLILLADKPPHKVGRYAVTGHLLLAYPAPLHAVRVGRLGGADAQQVFIVQRRVIAVIIAVRGQRGAEEIGRAVAVDDLSRVLAAAAHGKPILVCVGRIHFISPPSGRAALYRAACKCPPRCPARRRAPRPRCSP